ncbi:AAA family ATPase [Rhodoblastus acidophilus]|uniref:AAA family ATPase n=1 Tax=Candidatus Rhodoblastus alkanivorans TaxID=2954117 RepID=A0ABS9Z3U5_9HYPH|nr:AAA family ATPase [Candidatus Rhodoblastus alkanivorans]MCI4680854.1 AAA family ATPase [Candidatus Rhodoblastus alkanivorans]MCI4682293.1 AAA family ATPase [Candidatus Rhodoblastus alkanivorans]MDI4639595.1 AAA family ATPase [Rhodoblastus acidophilus]
MKKLAADGKVAIIGNLKGGCGKSTIAFNLAVWLAAAGDHPVLVDLDPQKTLTDLVSVREEIGATPQVAPPADTLSAAEGRRILVDFGAADAARMAQVIPEADLVLIPVLPSQADVWATQRYLKLVLAHRKASARIAFFVNRAESVETSRETRETVAVLKAMAGMCDNAVVLPTVLGRRVAYCRSLSEGLGVFEMKGQTKAAGEFERFAASVAALL